MLENRKQQFYGLLVLLLIIGVLNYFRKLVNGYSMTTVGKILYLSTMVVFTTGIMFVLYFTELNNILSFLIGLFVTVLSEHIANFFVVVGNNFNKIVNKFIYKYTKVDIAEELGCDKPKKQDDSTSKQTDNKN